MKKSLFTYEYYELDKYRGLVLPKHYDTSIVLPSKRFLHKHCMLGHLKSIKTERSYKILDCPENSAYFSGNDMTLTRAQYGRTRLQDDIYLFIDDAVTRVNKVKVKKLEQFINHKNATIPIVDIVPFGSYMQKGLLKENGEMVRLRLKEVIPIFGALKNRLESLIDDLPNAGYVKIGRHIKRVRFIY